MVNPWFPLYTDEPTQTLFQSYTQTKIESEERQTYPLLGSSLKCILNPKHRMSASKYRNIRYTATSIQHKRQQQHQPNQ